MTYTSVSFIRVSRTHPRTTVLGRLHSSDPYLTSEITNRILRQIHSIPRWRETHVYLLLTVYCPRQGTLSARWFVRSGGRTIPDLLQLSEYHPMGVLPR